ncbi:PDZ domain-containing protein [Piscinibacter sp.]|jgi:C-terminal processing protease CtpA/Prc|uniref:PDZ domain-containing protein n=1 Tax=Piscinibacter sp. TaxID=1903157 RepID=UPI0035AF273F
MKAGSVLRRLCLACLLALATAAHAGENGYLGINIKVERDGAFWNSTIKSVKVAKVVAGSSAEKAEVAVGDSIVEIEGRQVVGAKANDLRPQMQFAVGQQVKLMVKKPSGEVRAVVVVAGTKRE